MRMDETCANLRSKTACAREENTKCLQRQEHDDCADLRRGERIGTLIVAKYDEEFDDDDLLPMSTARWSVGMEMLRAITLGEIEIEARKKATVQIAINTLSFSERKAAFAILSASGQHEGPVVAPKIADQVKITRSVIVNALRN